jgi:L-histidine Nalpha-methyltransferase
MTRTLSPTIDVHLTPDDIAASLADDVARGLSRPQKMLPPKWFYDERGSDLFDAITRLEEYYPTEREREILRRIAPQLASGTGADTVIELGSGTSDKTRTVLDAFVDAGLLRRFVPFDVSEATLRAAIDMLAERYPEVALHGVVGDFERHLHTLPADGGRKLVLFLGGTVGNLRSAERHRFLADLAGALEPGDFLLLGTDLVKDVDRLVRAYDDGQGVTAAFNRNVLNVVNRELGADFDPARFEHEARWNAEEEWIEMHLVAGRPHTVHIPGIDLTVAFERGESIHTEISAKFRPAPLRRELTAAGFEPVELWTDPAGDYAVTLARRA